MTNCLAGSMTFLALGCVGPALLSAAVTSTPETTERSETSASETPAEEAVLVLGENELIRLSVVEPALYQADERVFGVHFRLRNLTDQDVAFDPRSADFAHPNQFGPLPQPPPRTLVDERRLPFEPIGAREVPLSRAGQLPIIPRGRAIDVFVPFRAETHPPDIFATLRTYVSIDGVVDARAQNGREARLSLAWRQGVGPEQTDLVLETPNIAPLHPPRCRERTHEVERGPDEPPIVLCGARW